MMKRRMILLCGLWVAAIAQAEIDPPGRAARLNFLSGNVSFQPGGSDDWVAAPLNRPLTTGDRLCTDAGARAELHIGNAAMRMNGKTGFSFLNLDDRTVQIQLTEGACIVRLLCLADNQSFKVDTPDLPMSLSPPPDVH